MNQNTPEREELPIPAALMDALLFHVNGDDRERVCNMIRAYGRLCRAGREDVPKVGDYVLVTKYEDGDPADHWGVGFYSGVGERCRHFAKDNEGNQLRASGFRRVGRITAECGAWLLENAKWLESAPAGFSLWDIANGRLSPQAGGEP